MPFFLFLCISVIKLILFSQRKEKRKKEERVFPCLPWHMGQPRSGNGGETTSVVGEASLSPLHALLLPLLCRHRRWRPLPPPRLRRQRPRRRLLVRLEQWLRRDRRDSHGGHRPRCHFGLLLSKVNRSSYYLIWFLGVADGMRGKGGSFCVDELSFPSIHLICIPSFNFSFPIHLIVIANTSIGTNGNVEVVD